MATAQVGNDTGAAGTVDLETAGVRPDVPGWHLDNAKGVLKGEDRHPVVHIRPRWLRMMMSQEGRHLPGPTEHSDHHVDDMPGHLEEHAALVGTQFLYETLVRTQILGQPGPKLVNASQLAFADPVEHLHDRRHVAEQVDHLQVQ